MTKSYILLMINHTQNSALGALKIVTFANSTLTKPWTLKRILVWSQLSSCSPCSGGHRYVNKSMDGKVYSIHPWFISNLATVQALEWVDGLLGYSICGGFRKAILEINLELLGLSWCLSVKETTCQWKRHGFNPWSRKIPPAPEKQSLWATTPDTVL